MTITPSSPVTPETHAIPSPVVGIGYVIWQRKGGKAEGPSYEQITDSRFLVEC